MQIYCHTESSQVRTVVQYSWTSSLWDCHRWTVEQKAWDMMISLCVDECIRQWVVWAVVVGVGASQPWTSNMKTKPLISSDTNIISQSSTAILGLGQSEANHDWWFDLQLIRHTQDEDGQSVVTRSNRTGTSMSMCSVRNTVTSRHLTRVVTQTRHWVCWTGSQRESASYETLKSF